MSEDAAQIAQLENLLHSRKRLRTIDRIFLSLGGNDAGFVPVISYAVIPPDHYGPAWPVTDPASVRILDLLLGEDGPVRPYAGHDAPPLRRFGGFRVPAETRLKGLPEVFATTARYLQALPGYRDNQVFQAEYANILQYGEGQFCRTSVAKASLDGLRANDQARENAYRETMGSDDVRGGFEALAGNVPGVFQSSRSWNFQFKFDPDVSCNPERKSPSDSEVCKAFWVWSELNHRVASNHGNWGWQIASAQKAETTSHGWCVSPHDSLNLPIWNAAVGGWTAYQQPKARLPSPALFDPYDEYLGRWFRTANDSALTQWAEPRQTSKGKRKLFYHNGSIHPTLNAHIAYAQAIYRMAFDEDDGL